MSVCQPTIITMSAMIQELLEAIDAAQQQDTETRLSDTWLLGFDTETTGARVGYDSIASATMVLRNPHQGHAADVVATWLINPHKPMHPKASEVNGFTNEYLQANGGEPQDELMPMAQALIAAQAKNIPLLAYNAPFDVSMLFHDLHRWQLDESLTLPDPTHLLVVDPLVIDRAVCIRRGKRTLTDTTQYYGVEPIGDFHNATADTVAAVDLVQPICQAYPAVANLKLSELMGWQRNAYMQWRNSFNSWLSAQGRMPITSTWL